MRGVGRIFAATVLTVAMFGLGGRERTVAAAPSAPIGMDIVSRPLSRTVAASSAPDRAVARQDALAQMQIALRVASRTCDADQRYAQLIIVHHAAFGDADAALRADYRRRFGAEGERVRADDTARTEKFFSDPSVLDDFCAAAARAGAEAAKLEAAELPGFAPLALARLERPFFAHQRPVDARQAGVALAMRAEPAAAKPEPRKPAPKPVAVAARPKPEPRPETVIGPDIGPTGYVVQLGAVASGDAAQAAWDDAVKRHEELGAHSAVRTRATARGRVVYRVAAGGFASSAEAVTLCDALKAKGTSCFVRSIGKS